MQVKRLNWLKQLGNIETLKDAQDRFRCDPNSFFFLTNAPDLQTVLMPGFNLWRCSTLKIPGLSNSPVGSFFLYKSRTSDLLFYEMMMYTCTIVSQHLKNSFGEWKIEFSYTYLFIEINTDKDDKILK